MGTQAAAVHQQVIERTKGLIYKSQHISANIDKKLATLQKQPFNEPLAVSFSLFFLEGELMNCYGVIFASFSG